MTFVYVSQGVICAVRGCVSFPVTGARRIAPAHHEFWRTAVLVLRQSLLALAIVGFGLAFWPSVSVGQSERYANLMKAGNASYQSGNYPDARQSYEAAYQEALKFGTETTQVATALNNLAEVYRLLGNFSKAEEFVAYALHVQRKLLGDDHIEVATVLNNLGNIRLQQQNIEGAIEALTSSLTIYDRTLPSNHPEIAMAANNLGRAHQALGRHAQAQYLHERALLILNKTRPNHPDMAATLNNLAGALISQDRLDPAEPMLKKALSIEENVFGKDHPRVATTLNNLGWLYFKQSRYADAEPLARRAIQIVESQFGPNHPVVAGNLANYAVLLRKLGREARRQAICRSRQGDQSSVRDRNNVGSRDAFGPPGATMKDGYRIVDSDLHVIELGDVYENYLDPKYRDVAPKFLGWSPANFPHWDVQGQIIPPWSTWSDVEGPQRALDGPTEDLYRDTKDRGYDARTTLSAMDQEGIDLGIVYRTFAHMVVSIDNLAPDVAIAYCAAFNDWLSDYCSNDPTRLKPAAILSLHDPELAAAEARRAVETRGHVAVVLLPMPVAGRMANDPELRRSLAGSNASRRASRVSWHQRRCR